MKITKLDESIKKYKLIKPYPLFIGKQERKLKLNSIVVWKETQKHYKFYKNGKFYTDFHFTAKEIENYPEYWREVKKEEYKKQPLFTTEDGVEIFENDKYWFVKPLQDYYLGEVIAIEHSMTGRKQENILDFSTKEKAEEYIIMNKPCLSLNDVNKAYSAPHGSNLHLNLIARLKQIIHSKP